MVTVLYRDLPKYNDRRRNLWLPEVVHQNYHGLQRTLSNPSLYSHNESISRYSKHMQNSPLWNRVNVGEGLGAQRHRLDSLSNSTASFPSNHCTMRLVLC